MFKKEDTNLLSKVISIGKFIALLFLFLAFTHKVFAFSQGVGAWFDRLSDDGRSWRIIISNTEETHAKGKSINAKFVVYQCRSKDTIPPHNYCAGDSDDFTGFREDITMPNTILPGSSDGDVTLGEKSFSRGFNCGRIQVDLAADGFDEVLGGRQINFANDCAAPTVPPTPTPTITPTPTVVCTNRSYPQCGNIPCNGRTFDPKHTISVVETTCGATKTYVCTDIGPKSGECGNPGPTPTPTQPVTPTPTPSGVPTATPIGATTPTPTPNQFSNAMCKCDGIEPSGLMQGGKAVVNTFGRVEGDDTTKAQITSMTYNFGVAQTKDPNKVKALITPVQIPAVIDRDTSSPSKVRYKTSFEFIVPTPPANNPLYRVWTEIKCTKKTTTALSNPSQVVLGGSTQRNTGLFESIKNAVLNLSTTVQTKISEVLGTTVDPQKSLQLSPIYPAQVEGDYCSSFWFQFKNP